MSISFPTNYESSDYCPDCKMGWWLHGRSESFPCDKKDPRWTPSAHKPSPGL